MSVAKEIENQVKSIPEIYYDFIVYITSGVIFFLALGYMFLTIEQLSTYINNLTTIKSILAIIVFSILINIVGQLASSFATIIIKEPIIYVYKILKKEKDDKFQYRRKVENRTEINHYWDDIYRMYINCPLIAKIMIKKYARVKLARANAVVVFFILVIYILAKRFHSFSPIFNEELFVLISAVLFFFFSIDYWLRQRWFNDGLKRFMNILNETKTLKI